MLSQVVCGILTHRCLIVAQIAGDFETAVAFVHNPKWVFRVWFLATQLPLRARQKVDIRGQKKSYTSWCQACLCNRARYRSAGTDLRGEGQRKRYKS